MAAGLGFKDFTTGEVLTAADVDGYLMQGIWVFASAAARDAAVTSPQEGNACYLKDTNQVLTYSGSAWVAVGGGSPLTTKGDLYGFSTVDARIPIGANNTVLTADSTQALGLKWAAPAGGGKVLQVVQGTLTGQVSSTTNSYIDTGLSVSITPSAITSKILIFATISSVQKDSPISGAVNCGAKFKLLRGSTNIFQATEWAAGNGMYTTGSVSGQQNVGTVSLNILDEPATTSSTTYKVQFGNYVNTTGVYINTYNTSDNIISTIVAMEIGA
jgi:hypothetical protein